ncbi:hypothetical protein B0H63DRAFT_194006 [Podospora didyma]|uniref:MARVEL domain-containing protein n=1 Tax=Podospora didyma TaxID=330526 RepID=A0AAE0NG56_9PEZI|nr:hypothetical protein B0H63DRAFT_194006 [Podospora didyma]
MAEIKESTGQKWRAPRAAFGSDEPYIIPTPLWVVIVRGAQVLFGFIILIIAALLMHGKVLDENAFAVAVTIFTWIVVAYALVTEKVPAANVAYNIWAVLALDLFLAILWLASMGANAALRGRFTQNVNIEGCSDNGNAVNSNTCVVSRSLEKRGTVATPAGLAQISAVAGLSALQMIFFIATLVFHGHTFRKFYQENKMPSADNAEAMMLSSQQGPASVHPQYADQQQYQAPLVQAYPQQLHPAGTAYESGGYDQQQQYAHQQHTEQQAAYPDPNQAQYQQQVAYSPHGTPAQGQPYYPPAQ